jgi:hypothetical protein
VVKLRVPGVKVMRRVHAVLTLAWLLAILPTILWWSESVLWIGLLSCWANAAGHFAAYQSTKAEQAAEG